MMRTRSKERGPTAQWVSSSAHNDSKMDTAHASGQTVVPLVHKVAYRTISHSHMNSCILHAHTSLCACTHTYTHTHTHTLLTSPLPPLSISSTGLDYTSKGVSHSYRVRSSSRPVDRDLRDPATAQNTEYTPPTTRFKSAKK